MIKSGTGSAFCRPAPTFGTPHQKRTSFQGFDVLADLTRRHFICRDPFRLRCQSPTQAHSFGSLGTASNSTVLAAPHTSGAFFSLITHSLIIADYKDFLRHALGVPAVHPKRWQHFEWLKPKNHRDLRL